MGYVTLASKYRPKQDAHSVVGCIGPAEEAVYVFTPGVVHDFQRESRLSLRHALPTVVNVGALCIRDPIRTLGEVKRAAF